ncbi:hypothetical protein WR25_13456 [Diploscapter pachys]|uniref:Transposase Tc1-like domain-containing protein n=1 Tax=Diploscapter pachys TaxID=2018661 RepID=A0A2A2KGJ2_9BILA|nr:hypothetical protein WR25_13456 [Diploscapter pachys]
MPSHKYYSLDLKQKAAAAVIKGKSICKVAATFSIPFASVQRWVTASKSQQPLGVKKKTGRPKKTTTDTDRLIVRTSQANPRLTAHEITAAAFAATVPNVSVRTVRRRLIDAGLNARRPAKKPLMSNKNRISRIHWTKEHKDWTEASWSTVL